MYYIRAISNYASDCWNALTTSDSTKLKRQSEVNIWQVPFKNQFGLLLAKLR